MHRSNYGSSRVQTKHEWFDTRAREAFATDIYGGSDGKSLYRLAYLDPEKFIPGELSKPILLEWEQWVETLPTKRERTPIIRWSIVWPYLLIAAVLTLFAAYDACASR